MIVRRIVLTIVTILRTSSSFDSVIEPPALIDGSIPNGPPLTPSAFIVPPNDFPENVMLLYCTTFDNVKAKLVPSFCSNKQVVPFSQGPDIFVTCLMLWSHFSHLCMKERKMKDDVLDISD